MQYSLNSFHVRCATEVIEKYVDIFVYKITELIITGNSEVCTLLYPLELNKNEKIYSC